MSFEPAHDIFLAYALETLLVQESTDGLTPAIAPAAPTSFGIVGYLKNTPEVRKGLNNSLGFAVGSKYAAFRKRGARNPEMSFTQTVTNKSFIQRAFPDNTGALPRLCFAIGRPGLWTILFRDSKIATLQLSGQENATGEASEITSQFSIWGCYLDYLTGNNALGFNTAVLLRALGDPFFWHDVRQFTVTSSEGDTTDYRQGTLSRFQVSIDNGLERKGLRQNWGDDVKTSNTNYYLLEHQQKVTGEIGLHGRIPTELFNEVAQAQDWGDIVLAMSTAPGLNTPSDGKTMTLTMEECMPSDDTLTGVEAGAQISSNVPYLAFGASIA